jgi:hypothetical protein
VGCCTVRVLSGSHNVVLLCAHHRYVHDHQVTIEVRPDGRHRFTLPDAGPLPISGQRTL